MIRKIDEEVFRINQSYFGCNGKKISTIKRLILKSQILFENPVISGTFLFLFETV
jgi:hypothetical protein